MKTKLFLFIALLIIGFLLPGTTYAQNYRAFKVVLDAGHGGKDSGTTGGKNYREKDIVLQIVLKLGKILEEHDDIEVIYTRKKDVFLKLIERANIANNADADLFVSVHCNASKSTQPYGAETYVLGLHRNKDNLDVAMRENSVIYLEENYEVTYGGFDPNSPESYIGMLLMQEEYLDQSILLASLVQDNFINDLKRKNRGVKQAGFLVIRETYMPRILIETGFLSNDKEGRYLNSDKGQSDMAKAIAKAILEYKTTLDLNLMEVSEKNSTPGEVYDGIEFKVQLAAGSKKLETASYNFKGLKNVERRKEDKLYKYYYGSTSDYLEIQELQREAQTAGFETSYVVAFRDGKKISVSEALKGKVD
ncbi:MAG TPA: N-acetylmuramoyl-L-alanine amidase [Flavobacteriaceae bacterium]|nr:N-acetylmuramoyl-L-alanine amidase [Flavobacteriaceae bacterium]